MSRFLSRTFLTTRVAVAVGALALGSLLTGASAQATVTLPNSMAATGDSITRAFDVNLAGFLSDAPAYSWATGTNTTVNSQYRRILARNPLISGKNFNDARTGAKMADLDGQVRTAAGQGVQYLTVLMGANDVCTPTIAGMTPTDTLATQFRTALTDFTATPAGATATVFVSSIPNLYQLWSVLHTSSAARNTWAAFKICPSMLAAANTEAQRQTVLARVQADNAALERVCREFTQCRWDGYATYAYRFTASQISTIDYFHPNTAGQAALAALTWTAGPYAGT